MFANKWNALEGITRRNVEMNEASFFIAMRINCTLYHGEMSAV